MSPARPTVVPKPDEPEQPWQWSEQRWRGIVERVRAGRTLRPDVWPGGARCAVAISFDSDHETGELREGGESIGRLSQGQYGNRAGIPRILALLQKYSIPATFYVPAVSAMLHPDEQFSKLGSVGRECVGSRPVRLLDPDGNDVPDGEPGELYSCNPYTFDGYWKLPFAIINNGNTVKNTEYSFLANVFAARGYLVASIQQDLPTDPPLMTEVGQPETGAELKEQYERQGQPYYSSARLWDDGVIDPLQTRRYVGLALGACANAPLAPASAPVFRM